MTGLGLKLFVFSVMMIHICPFTPMLDNVVFVFKIQNPTPPANDEDVSDKLDDQNLVQRCRDGDKHAFRILVARYQKKLFSIAFGMLHHPEDALDVVQEAFVQAYLKLASFKRNAAFYTWLYRIAFNTAVSRKRRKRVETSVDQTRENTGGEPIDEGDTPGDRMLRDEQASLVHAALDLLSDEHRAILILREMDELDYDTIAGILEINIGTVRSRLHRARAQMRDKIAEIESH